MRANPVRTLAALLAVGSLTLAAPAPAQDNTVNPSVAQAQAPALPYGVSQILQLQQAKVGDDTIIAYIRNSGNSFGLNADQIIYLRQQGVSSPVLNAMLSQPAPGVMGSSAPAMAANNSVQPAPAAYQTQPSASYSTVGPAVTAIDPTAAAAATTTYYYPSYGYSYYPAYSYPYYYPAYGYYGYYPSVSLSFGWGGRWGGGFRGGGWGGHGGWHR